MFKYKYDELINHCFREIKELNGSGTNDEIKEKLIEILNLNSDEIDDIHKNSATKLEYRSDWAKTYLKNAGYITNSARSVWAITEMGNKTDMVDNEEIKRKLNQI